MDILSHGLWGGATVGRKSKKSFLTAFIFGVAPDLFSFGIFTTTVWLGYVSGPDWSSGTPDSKSIPQYVHSLYDLTHSLIIFGVAFFLVWAYRRKPMYEMMAWGFHIVLDIFTHSDKFFPTPFLWPLSDFYVNGRSWGTPEIFIPNVVLLTVVYCYWWYQKHKHSPA